MVTTVLYGNCSICEEKGIVKEIEVIIGGSKSFPTYIKKYYCLKCNKTEEE